MKQPDKDVRHALGERVKVVQNAVTGEEVEWRWNVHTIALYQVWLRLKAGRQPPLWVVRRLLDALAAIDADAAANGGLTGWCELPPAVVLRHMIGEATYAQIAEAMSARARGGELLEQAMQASKVKFATSAARKARSGIQAEQAREDLAQLELLLRDEAVCTRYGLRRRVFMSSHSAAVDELIDLIYRDRQPDGLHILRDDFPAKPSRLRVFIKQLPDDLRPAKKATGRATKKSIRSTP
jgi:hypothetical protein